MEPQYVNVTAFMAKYRSKRECFTFLSIDGEAYLPPFDTVTVYFRKSADQLMIIVKDLIQGEKQCKQILLLLIILVVSCNSVRHLQVPQYDNLSMSKILAYLAQYEAMHLHMPAENHEINKLPRGWVVNVGATIVGQPFIEWVQKRIAERNMAMAKERNLLIRMNPQLAAAF